MDYINWLAIQYKSDLASLFYKNPDKMDVIIIFYKKFLKLYILIFDFSQYDYIAFS